MTLYGVLLFAKRYGFGCNCYFALSLSKQVTPKLVPFGASALDQDNHAKEAPTWSGAGREAKSSEIANGEKMAETKEDELATATVTIRIISASNIVTATMIIITIHIITVTIYYYY